MGQLIRWALATLGIIQASPVAAATHTLTLNPGSAQVAFRAYGLRVLPIDGAFTRFNGTLVVDSADPTACQVNIKAEAVSLQMPDSAMTKDALGADLLDVTRHPAFAFNGQCREGQVRGTLLLHGVSRPLTLDVGLERGRWVAAGRMRRANWDTGARPLLAGPAARIRFTAALPAGFLAAS